jgi:hypothetical protein
MNTVKPNAKLSRVWHLMRPEARKVFADFVGKSVNSFRHVAEGRRGISSDLAIRIEKASEKLDTRPRLTRMELNATCRNCEYAKACKKGKL